MSVSGEGCSQTTEIPDICPNIHVRGGLPASTLLTWPMSKYVCPRFYSNMCGMTNSDCCHVQCLCVLHCCSNIKFFMWHGTWKDLHHRNLTSNTILNIDPLSTRISTYIYYMFFQLALNFDSNCTRLSPSWVLDYHSNCTPSRYVLYFHPVSTRLTLNAYNIFIHQLLVFWQISTTLCNMYYKCTKFQNLRWTQK